MDIAGSYNGTARVPALRHTLSATDRHLVIHFIDALLAVAVVCNLGPLHRLPIAALESAPQPTYPQAHWRANVQSGRGPQRALSGVGAVGVGVEAVPA
jgi:hypothetical protein